MVSLESPSIPRRRVESSDLDLLLMLMLLLLNEMGTSPSSSSSDESSLVRLLLLLLPSLPPTSGTKRRPKRVSNGGRDELDISCSFDFSLRLSEEREEGGWS